MHVKRGKESKGEIEHHIFFRYCWYIFVSYVAAVNLKQKKPKKTLTELRMFVMKYAYIYVSQ